VIDLGMSHALLYSSFNKIILVGSKKKKSLPTSTPPPSLTVARLEGAMGGHGPLQLLIISKKNYI